MELGARLQPLFPDWSQALPALPVLRSLGALDHLGSAEGARDCPWPVSAGVICHWVEGGTDKCDGQ